MFSMGFAIDSLQWCIQNLLHVLGPRWCTLTLLNEVRYTVVPPPSGTCIWSPRPLQSLTDPALPRGRLNKASLCLISFSSMPVPRRSLLRPALNEFSMEPPPRYCPMERVRYCAEVDQGLLACNILQWFSLATYQQTPVGRKFWTHWIKTVNVRWNRTGCRITSYSLDTYTIFVHAISSVL